MFTPLDRVLCIITLLIAFNQRLSSCLSRYKKAYRYNTDDHEVLLSL